MRDLSTQRLELVVALLLLAAGQLFPAAPTTAQTPDFVTFESGQVRPLALSEDGNTLYVTNTPDGRLEILDAGGGALAHRASVAVGLEPVAVAVRSEREVWVVNHLSDSVSIVDPGASPPRVVRTLLVGDEPRDIVFAGADRRRAFITTARRGQHRTHPSLAEVPGAGDPLLTTPGTPRADVWVFDALALGESLGGTPLEIVELFGDTPRALAVTPDGQTVYAAVFLSGNGTTTVPEQAVCDGFAATDLPDACPDEHPGVPGGLPGPARNRLGDPAPEVGLIVQNDPATGEWNDPLGRDWSAAVKFDLPDFDVFRIDAMSLESAVAFRQVGTVLYNLAVHPTNGQVYVSNTDANNLTRFSGSGKIGGSTVKGHLHEARISIGLQGIDGPVVLHRHLNKHIDYSASPSPPGTQRGSLATPLGMAISSDGQTLYVAAFGSRRIGVFGTEDLATDTFDPRDATTRYIELSGGGPTGIVLDEDRGRLYTLTRFDNTVRAVSLASRRELSSLDLWNPEPDEVTVGRPFLYEARRFSSNGEASCASCHVFADFDGLAWDLGNPDAPVRRNPINIFRLGEAEEFSPPINGTGDPNDFHPMKGPMTTQTLRGVSTHGPLLWRGDRSNGTFGVDGLDPRLSLLNFDVEFTSILGRRIPPNRVQMERLADFVLKIVPPPNPNRPLENASQALDDGLQLFDFRNLDNEPANRRCGDCHTPRPLRGNFGSGGESSFQRATQIFKIPHLRNLYTKVGMFGAPQTDFLRPGSGGEHLGSQVRGFGFLHDGSVDTLLSFLRSINFLEDETGRTGFRNDAERLVLEDFLLSYESDLAPIVGQQVTLSGALAESPAAAAIRERIDLLFARALTPFTSRVLGGVVTECDLVVRGVVGGEVRGGVLDPIFLSFTSDRAGDPRFTLSQILQVASQPGNTLTFTCVPPGSGRRIAIDHDGDGALDRDERDAGTDPENPTSVPATP